MDSDFITIYETYHQDVYQFLFYMVKNQETAEDLMQEVYIRVMNSLNKFQGKSSEKTWLFAIARNVALDYFRKQKGWKNKLFQKFDWSNSKIIDSTQPLPEEIAVQNEESRLLYHCLDRCTIDQKSVIILRYIQDLSIAETAATLNWSESKVKTTQHRAMKQLKKMLNEEDKKGELTSENAELG
ncbi:RNA polymerase sigma-70 factor (ECF subfamily) [Oikeobacillus pervagus]|uniref:RNA polymerase sigma-70 factor (ECF subfamily) n=1 Tax=Oikeobacillus pervagus TaxID=1325931 RepID=A0AAJ1SW61_9BACI|nr:RNA polymerase sigma factor SigX [Oikeobacillus pervagus]MDQ0213734.1 RNA polymerase sigma-70 factor (ECF subfamily) [Oikeobacillus pervagus]